MPEQPQSRPQPKGNQCNMKDVMQRISLARPPVNLGMYRTLYMIDYQPFNEYLNQPPTSTTELAQQLKLDAQLKAKEFSRPIESEPEKYAEEPACQEVQSPYPDRVEGRCSKAREVPPPFQQVQEEPRKYFNPVLPVPTPYVEPTAERAIQEAPDACAMAGNTDVVNIKQDPGQNWDNYEQFILETRRAHHTQIKDIKKLHLGSSIFQDDLLTPTEASTYQRDYKYWPRVRSGFCRAHRNFSSLVFEDGYYPK
ncbi:hypothetical protein lerEdw1_017508 [Lerista edwardsae]|nr:hypothetical protein lerEdw1_017508 [Lerista edwardsae]